MIPDYLTETKMIKDTLIIDLKKICRRLFDFAEIPLQQLNMEHSSFFLYAYQTALEHAPN